MMLTWPPRRNHSTRQLCQDKTNIASRPSLSSSPAPPGQGMRPRQTLLPWVLQPRASLSCGHQISVCQSASQSLLVFSLHIGLHISLPQADGNVPLLVNVGHLIYLLSMIVSLTTSPLTITTRYPPCSEFWTSVWLFHPSQIWSEQRFCSVSSPRIPISLQYYQIPDIALKLLLLNQLINMMERKPSSHQSWSHQAFHHQSQQILASKINMIHKYIYLE